MYSLGDCFTDVRLNLGNTLILPIYTILSIEERPKLFKIYLHDTHSHTKPLFHNTTTTLCSYINR